MLPSALLLASRVSSSSASPVDPDARPKSNNNKSRRNNNNNNNKVALRSSPNKSNNGSPLKQPFKRFRLGNNSPNNNKNDNMEPTVLNWMETSCPCDLKPKILAYCQPTTVAALFQTNLHWHGIATKESTWKSLVEDLYKVRVCCIYALLVLYQNTLSTPRFSCFPL